MDGLLKVADKYHAVKQRIEQTSVQCGRDPDNIQLLVVTKGHQPGRVREVISSGAGMLGENYVQEALEKMEFINESGSVEWHMIGHIQSRKAKDVIDHFDFVHSLDRIKIAKRLSRYAVERNTRIPCLLECNVTGEESKYGWSLWDKNSWESVFEKFAEIFELEGIDIQGLMTMPPYHPDPEHSRPVFRKLVRLQEVLSQKFPDQNLKHLSMGMSDDYMVAIEEGATFLRIGTAIMGPRP